jgi:hypothetical protein
MIAGALMIGGGAGWSVSFIRFATEHPGFDDPLWMWPFLSAALLGSGALLAILARWAPVSGGRARAGAALVATAVAGFVPALAIIAILTFVAGSLVLGAGLSRSAQTRLPGLLIAVATGLFILTRPWMLGEVQTGSALAAQEVVEVVLAITLGAGWAFLGFTCLRGGRGPSAVGEG